MSLSFGGSGTRRSATGDADLTWLFLRAEGCALGHAAPSLLLAGCTFLEVGRLAGAGARAPIHSNRSSPWLALGELGRLVWQPLRAFELFSEAGLFAPFWGSAPCSACGSSSVHFLLYNRGQSHFHGLVTITASTLSEGTPATVPPAISQVIDVPSQGTNTSLAMEFDDEPGEVRVRLSAAGDCSAENDEYIVPIAEFGICQ